MEPTPSTKLPLAPFRGAWWFTAGASSLLVILRCIQLNRGQPLPPDALLLPVGFLGVSLGNLARRPGTRKPLILAGFVLLVVGLILHYRA